MELNEQKKSLIEFKRTMDIGADFAEQVAQGADSQYEILRYALGEVGQDGGWQIKQRNIIGETLESVHVEAIEEMLKVMEVKKKAWTTIRKEHVSRLLEVQDAVLLEYYECLYRGGSAMVKHHLGQDIYG